MLISISSTNELHIHPKLHVLCYGPHFHLYLFHMNGFHLKAFTHDLLCYVLTCFSCIADGGIIKIEAITRRILWITSTDPKAKLLVFSSWNDVLDVMEHAFNANNISYIRMKGGRLVSIYGTLTTLILFIYSCLDFRVCNHTSSMESYINLNQPDLNKIPGSSPAEFVF